MNCSRCDSSYPNKSCFVCAEDEQDERDAFAAAKNAVIDDEGTQTEQEYEQ